jgi:hypothetical protein
MIHRLNYFFVGTAQQALAQAKAEYEHATTAQGKVF